MEAEIANRFALYAASRKERAEIEYESYFDGFATAQDGLSAVPGDAACGQGTAKDPGAVWFDRKQDERHERRFFQAFYDSFADSEKRARENQTKAFLAAEASFRNCLAQDERSEWASLCRGFGRVLGVCQPSLLFVNALDAEKDEAVQRRVLSGSYFDVLLEACVLQEIMMRRYMEFVEESRTRQDIQAGEVASWIEARRLQVNHEKDCESQEAEKRRKQRLDYFQWRQQQLYQVFLLERSESQARETLEREERLEAGAVANKYNSSFRSARYAQLRFEDARRALDAVSSRNIATLEATSRSELLREQHDGFRCLGALEVRAYLATSRRQMENECMEAM